MGLFGDSRAPSFLFGPQTDVSAEPPSHRPCSPPLKARSHDIHEKLLTLSSVTPNAIIKVIWSFLLEANSHNR